ncbi:nucleoside hydrolase [Tricharina praecox]|uniref:nucleoside hydrolase n=1 Tax=Tricharina praecox TaxID=43433 RepID=UPI002220F234|nr:nucleoside hydrolase [Tricharina praecox]KAI5852003.1 nucleoside hydrolase [Tricharina praecox]
MAPKKIIIDTDPGVDDILALLLALSASAEEVEVLLISLCFGNIDVECCLRNTVSLFHVLELERTWRIENDLPLGFEALRNFKPVVSVGADLPIEGASMQYDYFHGKDGLQGVHENAPHFTPTEMWKHLFGPGDETDVSKVARLPPNFKPSTNLSHLEILRTLESHPPDTITIIAVGPLSNLALAANTDPETFLRAKEIVVMGGAINVPGNITPVAEFNQYACSYSAARIYALTSPSPKSTMPSCRDLKAYPENLSKQLKLTAFPLDVTTVHSLSLDTFNTVTKSLSERGSPLAQWMHHFLRPTFDHLKTLYTEKDVGLSLHDPLCVWYLLTNGEGWVIDESVDVRVETEGKWTRGMSVVDRRKKVIEANLLSPIKIHDRGVWLHRGHGNRVRLALDSEYKTSFGETMLRRIFAFEGKLDL